MTASIRTCFVQIEGQSTYSQSRRHDEPKLKKETDSDYEWRTWRERCNCYPNGAIYIPAFAFKLAIDGAAKMSGGKIPGAGNATYSKLFVTGVSIPSEVDLINPETGEVWTKKTARYEKVHCNANGKRGPGTRVWRWFPSFDRWACDLKVWVLDETIPAHVFERVLSHAGMSQGIGRFRPESGGSNGRFDCLRFTWHDGRL